MTFDVAVTAYREWERGDYAWIRACLAPALASPHVSEVFVYDDTGDDGSPSLERELFDRELSFDGELALLVETGRDNLGVLGAKIESVAACRADWVLMIDSDNVFDAAALDRLAAIEPDFHCIYAPSFARPAFDYRHLHGRWRLDVAPRLYREPMGGCLLNTGNQLVPRAQWLAVAAKYRAPRWDLRLPDWLGVGDRTDLKWRRVYDSADSLLLNAAWWRAGGTLEVVPDLAYDHRMPTDGPGPSTSSYRRAPAEKDQLPDLIVADLEREATAWLA